MTLENSAIIVGFETIKKLIGRVPVFYQKLAVSFLCVPVLFSVMHLICAASIYNYCLRFHLRFPFEGMPSLAFTVFWGSVLAWVVFQFASASLNYAAKTVAAEPDEITTKTRVILCVLTIVCFWLFMPFPDSLGIILVTLILFLFHWLPMWTSWLAGSISLIFAITLVTVLLVFQNDTADELLWLTGFGGGRNVIVLFEESGGATHAKEVSGCLLLRTNTSLFIMPWDSEKGQAWDSKKGRPWEEYLLKHIRQIRYQEGLEFNDEQKRMLKELNFKHFQRSEEDQPQK